MLIAPMAVMAQKFGYVDSQSVLESLPEIGKINGELEAKGKQFNDEITKMQDEFQLKSKEYDEKRSTLSPAAQQEEEIRDAMDITNEVKAELKKLK